MRPTRIAGYYGVGAVPGFLGRAADASGRHCPELTGLRGVAILIVVFGHLLQRIERFYGREVLGQIETVVLNVLATPFSGCRLLFCITGYTLILYLRQNANADRAGDGLNLLKSRLTRLWPPYFFVLSCTFLFIATTGYRPVGSHQFYAAPESLTLSFVASVLYLHDLAFNTFPRLFPPGWFLEVHFQFLIVGPVLWRAYLGLVRRSGRVVAAASFLTVSIALAIAAESYGPRGIQYSILAFSPYFLVGAIVAELNTTGRSQSAGIAPGRTWPIGLLGLLALIGLGTPCGAIWWQLPAQLVAIAAIMTACLTGRSAFRRAMSGRLLSRIGIASFSIYLVHLQILQVTVPLIVDRFRDYPFLLISLICLTIGLCLVLVVSLAFYWLVERPCVAFSLHQKRGSGAMAGAS